MESVGQSSIVHEDRELTTSPLRRNYSTTLTLVSGVLLLHVSLQTQVKSCTNRNPRTIGVTVKYAARGMRVMSLGLSGRPRCPPLVMSLLFVSIRSKGAGAAASRIIKKVFLVDQQHLTYQPVTTVLLLHTIDLPLPFGLRPHNQLVLIVESL